MTVNAPIVFSLEEEPMRAPARLHAPDRPVPAYARQLLAVWMVRRAR